MGLKPSLCADSAASSQCKSYCLKIKLLVLCQEKFSQALSNTLRKTLTSSSILYFPVFFLDCFYIHSLVQWGWKRESFCYFLTGFERSWIYRDCFPTQGRTQVTQRKTLLENASYGWRSHAGAYDIMNIVIISWKLLKKTDSFVTDINILLGVSAASIVCKGRLSCVCRNHARCHQPYQLLQETAGQSR